MKYKPFFTAQRQRQMVRCATRRTGYFNTKEYIAAGKILSNFSTKVFFLAGAALTIITCGAALPITAFVMFPGAMDIASSLKSRRK